jgi:tetratricopeptide (TPR) repeat protein
MLRVLAAACALALAGCAGLPAQPASAPALSGGSVELTRVPFFPQEQHQCGPAALAMALAAAGEPVAPEDLAGEVYLPGREGSLQPEMLAGARRRGLVAYPLAGGLEALHAELEAGTPVIVLQNLGLDWLPRWHYAVAIGYDAPGRQVILHSGTTRRLAMDLGVFDHTWLRSGRWAMLALPPGRLPASATAQAYLQAVLALEKAGQPKAANASYRAAARRWPESLVAWMGLGNTSHALGDLAGAERAFREAAQRHPESAAALNNLAQVLAERKRYPEAIKAARAAVRLGGRDAAAARQTLETILAQSAAP